ncbi:helix-turn-helix domain-containing protein [Microbulbifer agarilyticus]|uniref:helix-turn-helix domain-containing protein n=1 Tax=Microbulbifer agarilyticus TaxID=260552 RepID=UPI001C96B14B|nr:helix-turn-helix domain-containing protein [Microbulbifer agarilyticus]MBY6190682.1 helix-turn-helix domain-containing protein [Microbulbifer agarilyticus]
MYLKQLRKRQKWTQEQLAEFSGLNVRTIQRIESGKKPSLESLKSLASVFEVDISILEQEIGVIDKTTDDWKKLPLLFRMNFIGSEFGWLGMSKREDWVKAEKQVAVFSFIFAIGLLVVMALQGEFKTEAFIGPLWILVVAYGIANVIRAGDRYEIW